MSHSKIDLMNYLYCTIRQQLLQLGTPMSRPFSLPRWKRMNPFVPTQKATPESPWTRWVSSPPRQSAAAPFARYRPSSSSSSSAAAVPNVNHQFALQLNTICTFFLHRGLNTPSQSAGKTFIIDFSPHWSKKRLLLSLRWVDCVSWCVMGAPIGDVWNQTSFDVLKCCQNTTKTSHGNFV